MLMRPEYHEAKAEAEARKCEAKAAAKKSCEAEANIYAAEAMRPVTTMHLHSTTKNLFSLTLKIQLLQHTIVSICYLCLCIVNK